MAEHGGKAPPKNGGREKKSGGFWGFLGDVLSNVSVDINLGKPGRPGASARNPTDPAERMEPVHAERKEAYEETIYRKSEGAVGTAPAVRVDRDRKVIARSLDARMGGQADTKMPQGGGSPLSRDVRAKMEPRLGSDLSDVRVHTGGESASAAEKLGARAFTTGSDVHFGAGQFAPGTKEGDRLIAHELTHVVQGQKSGVQRKADDGSGDAAAGADAAEGEQRVSQPHEPAEKEADAVADKVTDDLHAGDAADSGKGADKHGSAGGRAKGGEKAAAAGKGAQKSGPPGASAHAGGEKKGADGGGAHGDSAPAAQKDHGDAKASGAPPAASQKAETKEAAPAVGAKLVRAPVPINERVSDSSVGRKIFRQEKKKPPAPAPAPAPAATPAKPAAGGAQQQTPAAKPQVLWDGVTVKAPMSSGTERVQVRPAAPGADGNVGLWVANQPGATRLLAINKVFTGEKVQNQAGGRVVAAAIGKIADIEAAVTAVQVAKGKVDQDKISMLEGKANEAAAVVSDVGSKLRTNSLEGADHVRPMTNKVRLEFDKPDPADWKKPYVNKFIAEMVSQLQKQNTGINELTVDEWVVNREKFSPSEHLNDLDKKAKDAVLETLKERCEEGLPRATERLKNLKVKKAKLDAGLQALQAAAGAAPDVIKEALKKAKEAASDIKSTEAEIQGYIDAPPEIAAGLAGQKMDTTKLQGAGGREDAQTAWANKHKKAKAAIMKLIEANDPLVQEWVGIVKEVGELAVLHDPDQIAGGHGDIEKLPVVKEPTDANDTDGHAAWRDYLTKVKSHLGVKDINGSLGSQWKKQITVLQNAITADPDCPQEAYPLRKVNAQFVPK